ncbi:AAR042Wp [Eremothecium gossypii ATCC 10895]|uniref:SWI5-dependent HO expression protein 3 n=1 Tax=Eremothecium gossypii (strain ATCC 10895 / CBS 109.51 / FGSC 9923 / NRRL Y-1056) TaxID=284811 RepID=SHE3_EREGS|nr:AAR042Wp [Eremothecium gossypii ATCC 10895]Q75EN7.1 RecName: Full=SWI5-dependent HO expression protein 3 [Eremothecium gossypii ATCC 10895]AAS50407.1 AAR042Wp [Eremothecium gossypii ATCC 10895]AEY94693.1 FAAR042Wp [Eremothecium gossypii FDAG1]
MAATNAVEAGYGGAAENGGCAEGLLGSPMRFSPSSKLKVNHGHFMANINNNAGPGKGGTAAGGTSPTREASYANVSGSGKVIENLHQQVDALTSTNLQLTKQSNQLLEKLEGCNAREAKYLETISSLKHENENLNSMLNRKTRRVKDLDMELVQLRTSHEEATASHNQLKYQLENKFAHETELEQQCQLLQAQYDAVVDAQRRYREHYQKEIEELREALEALKKDNDKFLGEHMARLTRSQLDIDKSMSDYNGKFHRMELSQKEAVIELNEKYDRMRADLDVDGWIVLYKQMRDIAFDYAKQLDLSLPKEFAELHGEDGYYAKMLDEDRQSSPVSTSSTAVEPMSQPSPSMSAQTLSPPPLRVPKNRTPITKRSSFYGNTMPGANISLTSATGLLPGVKRTGSIRSFHGRAPSEGLSDTPTIFTASRNASPMEFPQRSALTSAASANATVRHSSVPRHRRNQSSQVGNNK